MLEKGAVKEYGEREVRVIRKIVVSYYLESDPKTERTLTIAHGGDGEVVDGLIWNGELVRKLAYLENERCTAAKNLPGEGMWKLEAGSGGDAGGTCIWVHGEDCMWYEYCTDEI